MTVASSSALASRNGPAGRGEDEPGHLSHPFAGEALPDRRMLRIDRPEPGERTGQRIVGSLGGDGRGALAGQGHHEMAAGDERLLVRGGDDLAGPQRREDRAEADDAPRADHDEIDVPRVASATRASGSVSTVVPVGRSSERPDAGSPGSATTSGCRRRACSSRSRAWWPVASATTRTAPPRPMRTSTAWRPIEPPEPSSAIRSGPDVDRDAVAVRLTGGRSARTGSGRGPRTATSRPGRGCRHDRG